MFKGCFARGNKITVVLCVCITNVRVQISFSPKYKYLVYSIFKYINILKRFILFNYYYEKYNAYTIKLLCFILKKI